MIIFIIHKATSGVVDWMYLVQVDFPNFLFVCSNSFLKVDRIFSFQRARLINYDTLENYQALP